MNKRLTLLLVLLLVWAVPSGAQDSETEATVEGSNYLRWDEGDEVDSRLPESEYPDNTIARRFVENRLRLDVYYGNLRVGGRFLHFRPSDEDIYRDGLADVSTIDKRYIEATLWPFTIRGGDFSDIWAHGLAFSSYENRDLYFDTELDGVHVALKSEPLFITLLHGSSQKGIYVEEADVSGSRVNLRFGGQALGFNYLFVDSGAYRETHISGFDWRLSRGAFTFYGERAWSESVLSPKSSEGHATYLGGVVSKCGWSLLAEYKDYHYVILTPFQSPPTVYRELGPRLLQTREPHVLRPADEVGYQVELSGQATSTTFTTLHYNLSSSHAKHQGGIPRPTLQEADDPFWEFFVNAEQSLPGARSLFVELGANEDAFGVWRKRKWGWLKFTTPLRGSQELEIHSETLLITHPRRADEEFTDQLIGLGWFDGRSLSVSLQYEMSNDKELKEREGDGWPSAEIATTLGRGKHRIGLFYGRERGGLKCSNGVCRQVQPFTGWRLSLETTL
ncbi:hypothetical protein KKH27_06605 [bacterium]|nr:hypothetical protein [bacterium]MBU1985158.1 hypothetical protein [bacterium]